MRMVLEDGDLEEFVMSGESDIAVPIEFFVPVEGEARLTVYSAFSEVAKGFISRFSSDLFSSEALGYLDSAFTQPMMEAGYRKDIRGDYRILSYSSVGADIKPPVCELEIVKISSNEEFEKYYNDTTRDVEFDPDDPCDVCFAAIENGNIVSYAAVNDLSEDDTVEINVETCPHARGRGLATAVVSSLCHYLMGFGETVGYRCRISNAASVRVAEKVGLKMTGEGYSFVCYRT